VCLFLHDEMHEFDLVRFIWIVTAERLMINEIKREWEGHKPVNSIYKIPTMDLNGCTGTESSIVPPHLDHIRVYMRSSLNLNVHILRPPHILHYDTTVSLELKTWAPFLTSSFRVTISTEIFNSVWTPYPKICNYYYL
jgi:hypothetical protein